MMEYQFTPGKCKFVLTLVLALSFVSAHAFEPSDYFEKKCTSCHTIGGGADVGPDLKDVTSRREQKWLIAFIRDSQSLVEAGDATAVKLFNEFRQKKMPENDLSDEEIITILKYIESGLAGAGVSTKFKSALDAKEWEVENGKKLFQGEIRFTKGGPACLSCHSAGSAGILGGGGLAKDLTSAYSNYTDSGISKNLTNINFNVMRDVYKDKGLTEEEVFQVKSYLYHVDKQGQVDLAGDNIKKFVFLGIIGTLLVLGAMDLIWRKRKKKTVRPLR